MLAAPTDTHDRGQGAVQAAPRMLEKRITGARAWKRDSLTDDDWFVPLTREALTEIEHAARQLRRRPAPMTQLDAADFELGACRALMAGVRHRLDQGAQFAVLDRLPVETLSREEGAGVAWLLSTLVARPVPQKYNGQMYFEVRDLGQPQRPGAGIRGTVTNADMTFHNDNSFNTLPPNYVALLCQQPARVGGTSRVLSFYTVHNELLANAPEVLPRLYQPVWWDRHREHAEGDAPCLALAPFRFDGTELHVRYGIFNIRSGAAMRGQPLDAEAVRAIDAVQAVFDDPAHSVEFDLRPGQIQFVNNHSTGHARTAFEDHDEPARKRHLLRLWLRDSGKASYDGA